MSVAINVENVKKSFQVGSQNIEVLKGITFSIESGDFLVIFGPSGCGKSTLLHIVLGLEEPSSGKVEMLDTNLYAKTTEDDRSNFRKTHIGMIYQQPNWIKSLTVVENVAFPLVISGIEKPKAIAKAGEVLKTIGMFDWRDYIPTELSSGQQQRVALARGLVTDPEIIIADEPTGNLDYDSGQALMQLLTDLNKTRKNTIVMVTHDLEYLNFAKTAVRMFDGEVVGIYGENDKKKLMSEIKTKRGKGVASLA